MIRNLSLTKYPSTVILMITFLIIVSFIVHVIEYLGCDRCEVVLSPHNIVINVVVDIIIIVAIYKYNYDEAVLYTTIIVSNHFDS